MSDATPAGIPRQIIEGSVPPISRLSYFDVLLGVLLDRPTRLDDLRVAIGRHVEDLASRGEARRTRDWREPLAYRDTVVACVRELVRWNLVLPVSLGDDVAAYERSRDNVDMGIMSRVLGMQIEEPDAPAAARSDDDASSLIG